MKYVKYRSYYSILLSALFPFLGFWQMNLMNVLGNYLLNSFYIQQMYINYITASYVFADALFLIPVGILLDKISIKYVLTIGLCCFNLGTLISAVAPDFYLMLLGRTISGTGHAFALMSCFKLVCNTMKDNRQATWISIVLTIAFCGGLMAQAPTLIIIHHIGWRGVLRLLLICGILIGVIILMALPHTYSLIKRQDKNFSFKLLVPSLLNTKNWLCGIFISILDIPIMIMGATSGIIFLKSKHISIEQASRVTAAIYLGTLVGNLILGSLSDRFKRKELLILFCCSIVAVLLFVANFINTMFYWYYVIIFVLCGFFSSIQSIGYTLVWRVNQQYIASTAMAIVNVILMLGIAILQISFGYLYNIFMMKAFYILPLLFVIASIIGVYLYKTSKDI